MDSLISESNEVNVPIRYINSGRIKEAEYEIILLKPCMGENAETLLMDDYGEFIKTTITTIYDENSKYGKNNDCTYSILRKEPYYIEETFWVYGFHPSFQRKNANFIYNSFITPLKSFGYYANRIACFKNKLIILGEEKTNMVICKNKKDCIRLYNYIEEKSKKEKIKKILWCGCVGKKGNKYWYDKIRELTNWNYTKIMRSSTRP
jgi:hypothetical protein